MPIRRVERSDRGASAIEYAGLIVLAALILGALVLIVPGAIGRTLPAALCKILNISDVATCAGGSTTGTPKIDIKPQWCLSHEHVEEGNVGISYAIFNIGEGFQEIRYDSNEEDFDGKTKHYVYLMFVNKGDVGIDIEKAKAGKKIDIGGGEYVNYGDLYRLTPAEYQKFKDGIEEYQAEQVEERTSGNPFSYFGHWVYHKIKGDDWPPHIPNPQITFSTHSEEGQGEGRLPINLDSKLKTPAKYVLPNGASVATTQGHEVHTEHWYLYKDDKGNVLPATATYHTINGSYTVSADRTGSKTSASGRGVNGDVNVNRTWLYSNTTRITRDDKTGKLRNIRYAITYGDNNSLGTSLGLTGKEPAGKGKGQAGLGYTNTHGKGKLHTEVVQLNFDLNDQQEQQTGENWLKNHGLDMPPEVADQVFPKTGRAPGIPDAKPAASPPPADADPFDKLIYNKAMGWRTDGDASDKTQEFNATIPIGRGVGFDVNTSTSDSQTKHAEILDAPGPDGQRRWINYPDCTAAGNH